MQSLQPVDGILEVIQNAHGPMWRICSDGVCLTDFSGGRLLERYQALLIDQGKEAPAWLQEAQR